MFVFLFNNLWVKEFYGTYYTMTVFWIGKGVDLLTFEKKTKFSSLTLKCKVNFIFFQRSLKNLEKIEFVSMEAQNAHKVGMLLNQSTSKACLSLLSSSYASVNVQVFSQEPATIIECSNIYILVYYYAKILANNIGVLRHFMLYLTSWFICL